MPLSIQPFLKFWENLLKAKPAQQALAMLMFMATLLLVILLFAKLETSLKWFVLTPLVVLTFLAGLFLLWRMWKADSSAGVAAAADPLPEATSAEIGSSLPASERLIVGKLRKLELGEIPGAAPNRYISKPIRVSQQRLLTLFDRISPT
ncbi:MAG: hypothetical protein L0Y71_14535 [Gemmataceae bacterium]|nr:hypothetical protein [Gemmataceae bacterium]